MKVLKYIFLLYLLSIGNGKMIYPNCISGLNEPVSLETISIPLNNTVQLGIPNSIKGSTGSKSCYWRIKFAADNQEIQIIFNEFRLNDTNIFYHKSSMEYLEIKFPDHLKDKNMKFYGTSYPKELQLTSDRDVYFDIVLHSNFYNIDFNIMIRNDVIITSKVFELTVGKKPMYIYSPGYPSTYYKYSNMTWKLTANDTTSRIMFEFLWLKTENDCIYDFVEIKGDKTKFNTCGYQSRFLVAANDSSVRLMFESDGFTEYDGFVVRYYTVPYPDYTESCVKEGLKLTAIPYIPQLLTVTKTNDKDCKWIIEPDTKNKNHVIVFEIVSYFTSKFRCDQRLYITDKFSSQLAADHFGQNIPTANVTDLGGMVSNCINKVVQYYRSMSSGINVRLVDSSQDFSDVIGNMTFSYYSEPRDVYSHNIIHIGYRPSYIWLLKSKIGESDNNEILLKADNGCIKLELSDEKIRTFKDDIGNYIEIYDGYSDEAQDLVNGCDENRTGSTISGTKPFMFIRMKELLRLPMQPTLLEITSTDQCQGFVQKIKVPEHPGSVKIYNPKYKQSVPMNLVCHYEVLTSDDRAVLSIQGRSEHRVVTCNDKLEFYVSGIKFFSWCFTSDFSIVAPDNKIRFTLQTDDVFDSITYSITLTENIPTEPTTPPGQCNGRKILKPQAGLNYTITSPNYLQNYPLNLHCEWFIVAPGGYEIKLTLKKSKLPTSCSDKLKLFKGRDSWIEFKVFDYCENYPYVNDIQFVSDNGVFLLEFSADSGYNAYASFEVIYTLVKASSEADLSLTLRQQTFTFDSSWETYGVPVKRHFIKPDGTYLQYRIVIYASGVDTNFCRTGSIFFANVITNAEYYERIDLCDKIQNYTLYGMSDEVTMETYVYKDYSDDPYTITIVYNLEKLPDCSPGRPLLLFAKEDYDTFTSPNYPGHYSNNQYCQWKIIGSEDSILLLEVLYSDLGYSSNANFRDYVAIYDGSDRYSSLLGKFTGSTREYYTSSSHTVFIEFYSDATETNTGFKIKFRMEKIVNSPVSEGSSTNTVATIAGCIAALIFILVFCIVCGVCCKRKRVNRRRGRARESSVVYNSSNNTMFVISPVISHNTASPPPYSAIDIMGISQLTQPQGPATDELPPPYSELPSYEDSKQYEIPNSRSFSPDNTLNSTMESSSGQWDASSAYLSESRNELHQEPSDQLQGIDNPALSLSVSTTV